MLDAVVHCTQVYRKMINPEFETQVMALAAERDECEKTKKRKHSSCCVSCMKGHTSRGACLYWMSILHAQAAGRM